MALSSAVQVNHSNTTAPTHLHSFTNLQNHHHHLPTAKMQFTTVFTLAASAVAVMAVPAEYGSSAAAPMESSAASVSTAFASTNEESFTDQQQSANMCSEEQQVSCCNKKNSNDLLDFIGGSCHAFQASMGGAGTQYLSLALDNFGTDSFSSHPELQPGLHCLLSYRQADRPHPDWLHLHANQHLSALGGDLHLASVLVFPIASLASATSLLDLLRISNG